MSVPRGEVAAWVRQWAQEMGIPCRAREAGWELPLPDGRHVEATARDGKFQVCAALPSIMGAWSPERLLRWQFENAAVVSMASPPSPRLQMGATLPLQGLTEGQVTTLFNALEGRPADDGAKALADRRHGDLAVARQWWEREHGGLGVREREGGLSLRCQPSKSALPIAVCAEPTGLGVRLRCDLIAEPFIEPDCAAALHRYLLILNAHIALGGFALAADGSPTFCVLLPAPVSSAHVAHGVGSLLSCHGRFARAVKTMATNGTVSDWWDRFNPGEKGGGN